MNKKILFLFLNIFLIIFLPLNIYANTEENVVTEVSLYEEMLSTTNVSDMYNLLLQNQENVNFTIDELEVLKTHAEEIYILSGDTENVYSDLIDTLDYLLNNLDLGDVSILAELTTGTYTWNGGSQGAITIPVGNNVTINISGTVTITGKITVSENATLTIKGSGTLLRGSGYQNPILDIYDTGKLIIEGTSTTSRIIIDGNYGLKQTTESTLIRCDQDLVLKNVTLQSNYTDRYRDAEDEEDLTVNSEDTHAGGAITILNHDNNVTIDNCIIKDCKAVNGGAIYFCRLGTGTVNISNTTINNCEATGAKGGGAIFIDGILKTGESVDIKNIANYTINMNNVTISNCKAGNGSAIYMHYKCSSKIIMTNCTVSDNTTPTSGNYGTIRTDGNSNCELTISGGKIYNNTSTGAGGGIYWNASGTNSQLIVKDNVQIYNNVAGTQGGGLFLEGKNMLIQSADIYNNKAAMGGGIGIKTFADSSVKDGNWSSTDSFNLTLSKEVTIANNIATQKGGGLSYNIVDGIPEDGFSFYYINDGAVFENNIVSSDSGTTIDGVGGAIAIINATTSKKYNVKTEIKAGILKDNKAADGGALHSTIGDFLMTGGSIENHNVSGNGGAVFISDGEFELSGSAEIKNCTATNGGGLNISGGNAKITGGSIYNCRADNGGGIFISNGDVLMNGGTIYNNQALNYGGGIYASSDTQNLNVEILSGSIIGNIANKNGGGVGVNIDDGYSASIIIGLKDCMGINNNHSHPIIRDNTGNENGGGFWLNGDNMIMNMYCGFIENNIALLEPGSSNIYQTGGKATVYGGEVGEGVIVIGGEYVYIPDDDIPEIYITYNSNIEGNIVTKKAAVTVGVNIFLPKNLFTRENYILIGWSYVQLPGDNDVIYETGSPYTVPENDVTVYAIWRKIGAGEIEKPVIKEGKIYNEITGEANIMITANSSFTAQMVVNGMNPNIYTNRTLSFDKNLPNGTTILMIDNTNLSTRKFYYYKAINDSTNKIELTDFIKMQTSENYNILSGENVVDESFLFIVELPMNNTETGPTQMVLTRVSSDPEIATIKQTLSFTTTEKRAFDLSVESDNYKVGENFKVSYAESDPNGDDNRFYNKKLTLVISAMENNYIPEDAILIDNLSEYKLDGENRFIIPLDKATTNIEKELKIISETLLKNGLGCKLKAELYVSENEDNIRPFMGEKVDVVDNISLDSINNFALNLKMSDRVRWIDDIGDNLSIDYEALNINGDYNAILEIQKKSETGDYITKADMISNISIGEALGNGEYKLNLEEKGKIQINFIDNLSLEKGTYRVLIKVLKEDKTILEVPYNFIILEKAS